MAGRSVSRIVRQGYYRPVFLFCHLVFGHFEIQVLSPVNWNFQGISGILAAITYKRHFWIISTESGDNFPVHKHRNAVHLHVVACVASRQNRELLKLIFVIFQLSVNLSSWSFLFWIAATASDQCPKYGFISKPSSFSKLRKTRRQS